LSEPIIWALTNKYMKKFKFLKRENNVFENDSFITLRNNLIKKSNFIQKVLNF